MTSPETRENGSEHWVGFETESLATHVSRSTLGPPYHNVILVDGRRAAPESARPWVGSASPNVIIVSGGDPMTELAGKVQWFDRFEVRRPKGFLEILVRLVQGSVAFFLSSVALAMVAALVLTGGRHLAHDSELAVPILLVVLAALMVLVTVQRYLYWRVDQAGIHQYCFGLRNWSLPWADIVSRELGPPGNPWVFFLIIPIMGGPYQAIILENCQGRRRKVNRLATNGDRLDALVRYYLNPGGEAKFSHTYSDAVREAQAISARQDPAQAELHFATRDAPVVRMKLHEPLLLPVCCNCLGPATVRTPIPMSPGLIGFLNDPFVRLMIPLCSACHARTRRKGLGRIFRATGAIILIIVGTLFFTIASVENSLWIIALFVSLGVACLVGVLATVRSEIRRPSPAKLVKVVRANFRQGWMDVRFGNREYARLVGDLNQQRADSPTFWNDPAGSKKEIPEALREL